MIHFARVNILKKNKLMVKPFAFRIVLTTITIYAILQMGCTDSKNQAKDFKNCKYGTPSAIFSQALKQVKAHSFQLKPQEAIEIIHFDNDVKLELIQSGCDEIRQEFRFTIKNFQKTNFQHTIDEALEQLRYLGGLSDQYASFSFWSDAIAQKRTQLKAGKVYEIESNRFVKIDLIPEDKQAILIVEFLNN